MFVFVVPALAPRVSFQMRSRSGCPRTLPATKRAPEQKRKAFQADTVSTRKRFDFEVFGHEALECLFLWCPRLPPECLFEFVCALAAPERCPPQKQPPSKSANPSKETRFRHVNVLTLRFLATRLFCGGQRSGAARTRTHLKRHSGGKRGHHKKQAV